MRAHKRFALSLVLGATVFLVASIVVRQHIPDEYIGAQRAYLAEVETQLAEFDSLAPRQRIALVGSSPVILGLSAEEIETATGTPARNLAMDASRSVFDDYASMIVEHIRPGDVVIVANPNLRRSPQMEIPLSCVKHFGFECMRAQSGFRPRILQDALVLFTDRAFGNEPQPRTQRGDYIFSGAPQFEEFRPKFTGPFPANGVAAMAKLAADIRRRGGCPIFVLTPLLPEPKDVPLWQDEFAKLWRQIDEAGLHDVVVEDSPLWNERKLFHHDEHMSEQGRKVWTASIIAKLRQNGLPASCGGDEARSN